MKLACGILLVALVVPSAYGFFRELASKGASVASAGVHLANRATGATLNTAASLTSNIPMVGGAVGSANNFYHEATTVRGAIRILGRSLQTGVNLIGRSNVVKIIKMFRDAVLRAMESAKQHLVERLSSVPVVGLYLKSGDDVLTMMTEYGSQAGLPTEAITAAYTALLLFINGFLSAF